MVVRVALRSLVASSLGRGSNRTLFFNRYSIFVIVYFDNYRVADYNGGGEGREQQQQYTRGRQRGSVAAPEESVETLSPCHLDV